MLTRRGGSLEQLWYQYYDAWKQSTPSTITTTTTSIIDTTTSQLIPHVLISFHDMVQQSWDILQGTRSIRESVWLTNEEEKQLMR